MHEVIGGGRIELDGQSGAVTVAELIGVQAWLEAEGHAGAQDALALFARENTALDKCITINSKLIVYDCGQDLLDDLIDVGIATPFRRKLVGREARRHQAHGRAFIRCPDGAKLLQLIFDIESIAALRFGSSGAVTHHGTCALDDVLHQACLARGARGAYRRRDASAGSSNLLVAFALQTAIELRFAKTGPRKMGMGVDESRNGGRTAGVEVFGDGKIGAPLRADVVDLSVAHDDDGILEHLNAAHGRAAYGAASDWCGDLREIANE